MIQGRSWKVVDTYSADEELSCF